MSPDDPRHGTYAGRWAHRASGVEPCDPCKEANATYMRRYRKTRTLYGDRLIDATGSIRRVQALMCLGWSMTQIGEHAGIGQKQLWYTTRQATVRRETAARIAAAYDWMSDTEPPATTMPERVSVGGTLGHARRNGFVPPIGWDDDNIDDPTAAPYDEDESEDIDEAVVERLLSSRRISSTRAEKVEAMRRWMASGRSQKSLCDIHGWQEGRYVERQDGAA